MSALDSDDLSEAANLNVQGHRASSLRSNEDGKENQTPPKPNSNPVIFQTSVAKIFDKEKTFSNPTKAHANRPQFGRFKTTLAVSTNYLNAMNPLQYGASIVELKPFSNRPTKTPKSTSSSSTSGHHPTVTVVDSKKPQPTISTLVNVLDEKSLFGLPNHVNKLQNAQSFDTSPVQHNEACVAASAELSRRVNDLNLLSQLDTLRAKLNLNQRSPTGGPYNNQSPLDWQQQQRNNTATSAELSAMAEYTAKKRSKSSFIINKKANDPRNKNAEYQTAEHADAEGDRNLLMYQQARTPMLNEYKHIVSVRDQNTPPAPPPTPRLQSAPW